MELTTKIRVRVAAAIVEEGRILLVKHLKDGVETLLLPGGGVEPGETLHEALARELREETGHEIEVGELVFMAESIPPDRHRHILHVCFRATRRPSPTPEVVHVPDDPRIVGLEWLPVEELAAVRLHPPFGEEIAQLLNVDAGVTRHLGCRWV